MHDRSIACSAHGALDCLSPVDAAVPGTEITILQMSPGVGNTKREFARFGEVKITGLHGSQ
jgi:hypothetical protein